MSEYGLEAILGPEIKSLLSEALSEESGNFSIEFLDNLKLKIKLFLLEIDNIMIRFNNNLQMSAIIQEPSLSMEYKRYIIAKKMIQSQPEIEEILKNGYIIIDEIREAFTGEQVKYYIGVTAGKNHQLYEGYLPLSEILKIAKLEPIWKNSEESIFKLRLRSTKGSLISALQPANDTHSTLWKSIAAYASINHIKNQGNLFEAYRLMKDLYHSNHIPPASWDTSIFDTNIEQIINSVRKNSISFAKGGDYLDESIKFFGGSAPSLASLNTIKDILQGIANSLDLVDSQSIKIALSNLFQKNPIADSITVDVAEESDQEINNLLSKLQQL